LLDVGCGDGLLLQRVAPFVRETVGIDPDSQAIARARERLAGSQNTSLIAGDFFDMPIPTPQDRFDTIVCVAALHHMPLQDALLQMRRLLKPGGKLLIVGLAANKSPMDYVRSVLLLVPIRVMDRVRGGMQDIGVRIADPKESLSEIRRVARELLPGSVVRQRFYYRYLLTWSSPPEERHESSK